MTFDVCMVRGDGPGWLVASVVLTKINNQNLQAELFLASAIAKKRLSQL